MDVSALGDSGALAPGRAPDSCGASYSSRRVRLAGTGP